MVDANFHENSLHALKKKKRKKKEKQKTKKSKRTRWYKCNVVTSSYSSSLPSTSLVLFPLLEHRSYLSDAHD